MIEYGLIAAQNAVEIVSPLINVFSDHKLTFAVLGACILIFAVFIMRK